MASLTALQKKNLPPEFHIFTSIHSWFITASGPSHVAHKQNSVIQQSLWPHPPLDNHRKFAQEEQGQFFFFSSALLEKYTIEAADPVILTNRIISALHAV